MKTTLTIASIVAFAGLNQIAAAGTLTDPIIEAPLIVQDATSSSNGTSLVIALAILMSIPAFAD